MSNRYARILAAGSAAALVAALGAPTALAATAAKTWTIQPGGAVHAKPGKLVLKDTATGTVITCVALTGFPSIVRGRLKSGSGLPGSQAGSLRTASFGRCTGPDGPVFTAQAGGMPWPVNLSFYNAARGVVRGTIRHLHLTLGGQGCDAMIDGTGATADDGQVAFRYTDSTGQLTVLTSGGNLHIYDVSSGCLGLVNDGDPATLNVTYTVTPEQAITSP
jgi:hypothetical protein